MQKPFLDLAMKAITPLRASANKFWQRQTTASSTGQKRLPTPVVRDNNWHSGSDHSHHSRTSHFYYLTALGIGAFTGGYWIANGTVSKEVEKIHRNYFPPDVSKQVSNIGTETPHSDPRFRSDSIQEQFSYALSHHNNHPVHFLVISGEAGIGKYSDVMRFAESQKNEHKRPYDTAYSIDASSPEKLSAGMQGLAVALGQTESPSATLTPSQYISDQIARRDHLSLIFRCARPGDFPGDNLKLSSVFRKPPVFIFITTGRDDVINEAKSRNIPVINLERSVQVQDLTAHFSRSENKQRIAESRLPYATQMVDRLNKNPRLVAQAVAFLDQNPNTTLFEYYADLDPKSPETSVVAKSLNRIDKTATLQTDAVSVINILTSKYEYGKGLPFQEMEAKFATDIQGSETPTRLTQRRLHNAVKILYDYDLLTYAPEQHLIFPRLLKGQIKCIQSGACVPTDVIEPPPIIEIKRDV